MLYAVYAVNRYKSTQLNNQIRAARYSFTHHRYTCINEMFHLIASGKLTCGSLLESQRLECFVLLSMRAGRLSLAKLCLPCRT